MRGRIRKHEQQGLNPFISWFSEDDAVTNTEKLECIAVVVPTLYRYIYVIRPCSRSREGEECRSVCDSTRYLADRMASLNSFSHGDHELVMICL